MKSEKQKDVTLCFYRWQQESESSGALCSPPDPVSPRPPRTRENPCCLISRQMLQFRQIISL